MESAVSLEDGASEHEWEKVIVVCTYLKIISKSGMSLFLYMLENNVIMLIKNKGMEVISDLILSNVQYQYTNETVTIKEQEFNDNFSLVFELFALFIKGTSLFELHFRSENGTLKVWKISQ